MTEIVRNGFATKEDMNRVIAKCNDILLLLRADRPRLAKELKWYRKYLGGAEVRRIIYGNSR